MIQLLICCLLGGVAAALQAAEVGTAEVQNLSLRSGPGLAYRIIARLDKGAQVRVLGREPGWLEVEYQGTKGFIADEGKYVRLTPLEVDPSPSSASPSTLERQALQNRNEKAEVIDERLKASQSEVATITGRETAVLGELEAAEEELNRLRQQVHAAEAGLEKIESQIGQMQNDYSALEQEITVNEDRAAHRLVALYKLSWIGRMQLLATAETFFDFIQRKSALERILQQDEALLEKLNQDQTAIESVLEKLNVTKAEKRSLELALKKQLQALEVEQDKRNALLAKIAGEKKLALAALSAAQSAAEALDTTMQMLLPPAPPPAATASKSAFDLYKGLLSWPVKGKILSFFGPYRDTKYKVTNFQRGIDIQAERGEPIRAVADGHTIFAKWFKGFGNMMVVDHGDHYYTVYAHLEEIFKVEGDRVDKGEVIATVGDSGSLMGPALHFEVRHRGEPLNPLEWIKKG